MKIDRLIAIIMILLECEKISADELAKIFEVSPRTIYRDLDSINQAGIPVAAVSGPGNGISIVKTYKVEKRLFSTSDITILLMALGCVQSNLPWQEIVNTLAKVKGMAPLDKQKELDFRANQIKIDVSPWLYAGGLSNKIEIIRSAMERQFLLRFDYRDIRSIKSEREIEPYRLLLKSEDWYIQGYCLIRQEFRTFKVLRMQDIRIVEKSFDLREFPAEKMNYAQFNDKALTFTKLRIHGEIRDMIVSRFGEECLTPDGAEHYIAQVYMPADDLACRYLMGFGSKCECLEPEAIRKRMYEISREVYRLYCPKQQKI